MPNIPEVSNSNEKIPSIKATPPTRVAAMVAMMMARTPPSAADQHQYALQFRF